MRILREGFEAYLEHLDELWGDKVHRNGWLRVELRITTSHALDWRELHFGCVHSIRDVPLHDNAHAKKALNLLQLADCFFTSCFIHPLWTL